MGERFVLNSKEASEYIGIGINRIRELCASGDIKAARSGKNWKIPKPMLERYVMEKAERGEEI